MDYGSLSIINVAARDVPVALLSLSPILLILLVFLESQLLLWLLLLLVSLLLLAFPDVPIVSYATVDPAVVTSGAPAAVYFCPSSSCCSKIQTFLLTITRDYNYC
jgi:hypothetical protein